MEAPETRIAFVAIVIAAIFIAAVHGGVILLLRLLRGRRASRLAPAPDDNWFVAKNDQQFGPITFDQLTTYARDGLLTRSDLLKRGASETWIPAHDVRGLFSLPPRVATTAAGRGSSEIARSAHDRVTAPVTEAEALQHVTEEALRHVAAQKSDPYRSAQERIGAAGRKRRNYFARHWRGELSLPVSYWINGTLAGIATILVIAAINASTNFKDDFQPGIALAAEILIWTTTSVIAVWRLVGVWRSATNYQKALKIFWGGFAKVLVIGGAAEAIASFAWSGAPQIKELYKIYRGDEELGGYAFRVLRDGRELEFSGGITFGAAREFQRFLDAMGVVTVVHLNSLGGRIAEAERIGQLLQARKLSTYVVNNCLSACTIIFLSGRERLISPQGRLGFHQPDFPGLTAEERRNIIANEEQRLRRLGVSAAFARKANMAPPDNMWFPSVSELIYERVATRVVDAFDFALSGIDVSDITEEGVEKHLMGDPMYAQIRKYEPGLYARVVKAFEEGLKRGASGTELIEAMEPHVGSTFMKMLPYAADEDILESMRVFVRNTSKIRTADPLECYYSVKSAEASKAMADAIKKKYPRENDEEWALRRRIIEKFSGANVRIPDEQEILPSKIKLQAAIWKRYGSDADLLASATIPVDKHSVLCSVSIAYYEEILKWPQKEAVAFFRYVRVHP